MIIPLHILPDLLHKTAHLVSNAAKYDRPDLAYRYEDLLFYQNVHVCKMFFTFVDEQPWWNNSHWRYCLSDSETGDYHWFTLNQLIICTD